MPPTLTLRGRVLAALLEQALAAQRAGTVAAWLAQRPQAGRRLLARHEALARAAAGDALPAGREPVLRLVLTWLLVGLRPDGEPSLEGIDAEAWLRRPAWRPALAALCHQGLLAVPEFPGRYRRRADEPALDNLCGLWDLAPSTVYRDLERAQSTMLAVALERPLSVPHRLALRRLAADAALPTGEARRDAHRALVRRALQRQDPVSALWHAWQAGDADAQADVLREHAPALASAVETEALVDRAMAAAPTAVHRARLWLARAVLARTLGQTARELSAIETALRVAQEAGGPVLGLAYGALGKFHEARDADRAFACYERSAELLRPAAPGFELEALRTLVRLAWLYALRQHPRTHDTLLQVDRLAQLQPLGARDRALVDDAWGEYWRLAGDLPQSMAARQRALLGYEAAGDRRQVLATLLNLVLAYGQAQDPRQALGLAARFFAEAGQGEVEPEMLVNAHGNVGIAHFFLGELDQAIAHYREAVIRADAADLRLHLHRNRYNLAEAHLQRFARAGDPRDEREADALIAALSKAPVNEATEPIVAAAQTLKDEILAPPARQVRDHLLSEEAAAHFDESAEIARQRAVLAAEGAPETHLAARLRIAEAYLAIAARERDAALTLARRHGLQAQAGPAVAGLHRIFAREQPREARLAADWSAAVGDWLDDSTRLAVAARLLADGALSKASYGDAAGVAPATASKHLAQLTAQGLLVQSGRGPATRYRLPPDSGSPGA
jgi:tetratricopeptide (TPR) repeat protein